MAITSHVHVRESMSQWQLPHIETYFVTYLGLGCYSNHSQEIPGGCEAFNTQKARETPLHATCKLETTPVSSLLFTDRVLLSYSMV